MEHDKKPTKYTLITNVEFLQFQKPEIPIRIEANALLIEEGAHGLGNTYNGFRGFGTESSAPTFKCWLPDGALPYTLIQNVSDDNKMFLGKKGAVSIFSGAILKFGTTMEFFVQACDTSKPVDVSTFVGDIHIVWETLFQKVISYWVAPYMPHQIFHSPSESERFQRW